jgi:hypothetical protein
VNRSKGSHAAAGSSFEHEQVNRSPAGGGGHGGFWLRIWKLSQAALRFWKLSQAVKLGPLDFGSCLKLSNWERRMLGHDGFGYCNVCKCLTCNWYFPL